LDFTAADFAEFGRLFEIPRGAVAAMLQNLIAAFDRHAKAAISKLTLDARLQQHILAASQNRIERLRNN